MFTDCSKILGVKLKCIIPYACFKYDQLCFFFTSNHIYLDYASKRDWDFFVTEDPAGYH